MIRQAAATLLLVCAASAHAATYTVTTNATLGPGSLGQAILDSNANPGFDTIAFAVGSGLVFITPNGLPPITDPVLIDGRTQPGYAGIPIVILDGNNGAPGLAVNAASTTLTQIWALGIRDTTHGIDAVSPVHVRGSWIGALGADANVFAAIHLNPANGSIIGGTTPAERNILGGNAQGVLVWNSTDVTIIGNYIGVDSSGASALPNGGGILMQLAPARIRVGGTAPGEGNVISGNFQGVAINGGTDITVAGNRIGTDASGLNAIPNQFVGVFSIASGVTIGGSTAAARNVISGNGDSGITISDGSNVDILNNFIGVDATGEAALPNHWAGIYIENADANVNIGLPGAGNVISGNAPRPDTTGGYGIALGGAPSSGRVRGNNIGISASGNVAIPNTASGILVWTHDAQIGGLAAGEGNRIERNGGHGILIGDPFVTANDNDVAGNTIRANTNDGIAVLGAASRANVFSQNSIDDNGGLAIDLANDGVTTNDFSDADTGSNQLQNYPQFDWALSSPAGTSVRGQLQSTPSTPFTLEFFSSPAGDPSGFGEGRTYIGSLGVTTNASGTAQFTFNNATVVPVGHVISGTATGADGTSEMARWVLVEAQATTSFSGAAFSIVENSGGTVTITVTRTNGTGPASVEYSTASGTATSGVDFPAQSGIINFADGQTSAQINIAITDDTINEADETFTVTLSNPTGTTLVSPSTATITILDNEIAPIPTASELGLLVMSLAIAMAAMLVLRRQ